MGEGYDYDWLCIGSGPAGQRAAVQAAKLGKRAAVVERGHIVGPTLAEYYKVAALDAYNKLMS